MSHILDFIVLWLAHLIRSNLAHTPTNSQLIEKESQWDQRGGRGETWREVGGFESSLLSPPSAALRSWLRVRGGCFELVHCSAFSFFFYEGQNRHKLPGNTHSHTVITVLLFIQQACPSADIWLVWVGVCLSLQSSYRRCVSLMKISPV